MRVRETELDREGEIEMSEEKERKKNDQVLKNKSGTRERENERKGNYNAKMRSLLFAADTPVRRLRANILPYANNKYRLATTADIQLLIGIQSEHIQYLFRNFGVRNTSDAHENKTKQTNKERKKERNRKK